MTTEPVRCQFCSELIDGDAYQCDSEYHTVNSCQKAECRIQADMRIEEIIEAEESGELD